MKDVIFKIIDKLDIGILLATAWLLAGVGVFLPKEYVEMIGLIGIKNKFQWIISSVFLAISAYYIIKILYTVYYKLVIKILKYRYKKKMPKILRKLSVDEQRILLTFYNEQEKKFGLQAKLDIQDATVNVLSSKNIISRGSQIGDLFEGFSYFIQPGVQVELNKMLSNGEIKVWDKKFEWVVESD